MIKCSVNTSNHITYHSSRHNYLPKIGSMTSSKVIMNFKSRLSFMVLLYHLWLSCSCCLYTYNDDILTWCTLKDIEFVVVSFFGSHLFSIWNYYFATFIIQLCCKQSVLNVLESIRKFLKTYSFCSPSNIAQYNY